MTVVAGIQSARQTCRVVAELTTSRVIEVFGMTEKTVIGQPPEYTTRMTITTIDKAMRTRQPKTGLIMQERAR